MREPLTVTAPSGTQLIELVRPLAMDGQLPLYWRCGHGTCGACLVYLRHAGSGQSVTPLSGKERNVLFRKGLLNETERAATTAPDTPALPRLACHVTLPDGWLLVRW